MTYNTVLPENLYGPCTTDDSGDIMDCDCGFIPESVKLKLKVDWDKANETLEGLRRDHL